MATMLDVKTRVKRELDTEDEDFISEPELEGYIRKAINSAENLILTMNEDYFLAKPHTITLQSGVTEYQLPSGIYANKIRKLIYDQGALDRYLVKRIKRVEETSSIELFDDYKYLITNDPTDGFRINIYPAPQSTGEVLKLWYLRNVNEPSLDADVIDLPEAFNYIVQYVKDECIKKERMTPDAPKSAALAEEERLLVEALTDRMPDEDNEIEPDLTFTMG